MSTAVYAGSVCGKCNTGMIGNDGLRVSDNFEAIFHKHYGKICDTCKRQLMYRAINNGFALSWDLPGHVLLSPIPKRLS